MPYVAIKCPNCGGGIGLNSNVEKGYCIHCRSLINFADAVRNSNTNGLIEFAGDKIHTAKYESMFDRTFRELRLYQKMIKHDIEKHLNKAYSIKWIFVFLTLLPAIFYIITKFSFMMGIQDTLATLKLLPESVLTTLLYIVIIILVFVLKTGYDEVKRKAAVILQITLFTKKCDSILKPLGIVDLEYVIDIFDIEVDELEAEFIKLQKAQDEIIDMDKSIFYKKPYIHYSFIDFLKGERPKEYYDK